MNVPADLKYASSHEWARLEGDLVTVGISDHAQAELTDVVFLELPRVGRQVNAGESVAVIESVKSANDIYAPVAGAAPEGRRAALVRLARAVAERSLVTLTLISSCCHCRRTTDFS